MRPPRALVGASFAAFSRFSRPGYCACALGLAPWPVVDALRLDPLLGARRHSTTDSSSGPFAAGRGIHATSASMSAPVTRAVAVDPDVLAPPFARYSHGCEVSFPPERKTRMVFVSGQLGVRPDGKCATDAYAQAVQCLKNVKAVLHASGMGVENIVRLNAYVKHDSHLKDYMRARDEWLEGADTQWPDGPPASTLMIVSGFARPEFKVEVEATAAK